MESQNLFKNISLAIITLCFILSSIFLAFLYMEVSSLNQKYEDLRGSITDGLWKCTGKRPDLQNTKDGDIDSPRVKRQLVPKNLFEDLLHAQTNIVLSHCTNDSKLCVQGPKGEKGDTGKVSNQLSGITGDQANQCQCIYPPIVPANRTQNSLTILPGQQQTLTCNVDGSPTPYITWTKDGNRIRQKQGRSLVVSDPGTYTCVAENIIGSASIVFNVA